jgi:hypothetical protein
MMQFSENELSRWLWEQETNGGSARLWRVLREGSAHIPESATAWREVELPHGRADFVVSGEGIVIAVELKAGVADGQALAQVLAYMAGLQERLDCAAEDAHVQGIIVASDFDERVRWACYADRLDVELVRVYPWFHGMPISDIGYDFDETKGKLSPCIHEIIGKASPLVDVEGQDNPFEIIEEDHADASQS